ncbi:potassium channel subfamily K member 1-like [Asterias rubens]|uniref:potassium channel subfamily K member 1-like n=1 Tax=Asterias rubens TaxID=7604 RepID=UPI0014556731|nr:potassium channel subfamily K member 1-like [Asterias rubens]
MKRWQQMLLAWFLFIAYLMVGAFVFRAIELPGEQLAVQEFTKSMDEFLALHPGVSKEEFFRYSLAVVKAVDRGVIDLNSYQIGGQGEGERKNTWDLPNAFFFSATVVTTIGYGDLTPYSDTGRICCMIYGAIGLPLTGWVLGVLARSLTAYWTKALDRANKLLKCCIKFARLRKALMFVITTTLLYMVLLQVPAILLGTIEQWDLLTSVYYCFVTLTTIGFGDVVPGTHTEYAELGRWVLRVCIVLYVIFGLSLLLALSTAIATRAHKTVKKTMMKENSYYLDDTASSKKRRERSRSMVENEIALQNVHGLSSARTDVPLTEPSDNQLPHLAKNMDEELAKVAAQEWADTLSSQTETGSPPCYDAIVDSSMSAHQNGRLSSTVAEMFTRTSSRERETRGERNDNASIITLTDCECANGNPVAVEMH